MRCVILLSIFAVAHSEKYHDLIIGDPVPGDILLFETIEYKAAIPLSETTSIIQYPAPGHTKFAVIRAIHIHDNYKNGEGGYATLIDGGTDQRFVKIELKSQRGGAFNFTVSIYGRIE